MRGTLRSRRVLFVDRPDRPSKFRLRRWVTLSMERNNGEVLMRLGLKNEGMVWSADSVEVALFLLVHASHLRKELEYG